MAAEIVDDGRPKRVTSPAITGVFEEGELLSVSTGTWTNSPSSFAYQWYRDGVAISGATSPTYTTTATDLDTVISCVVSATNANGTTNTSATGASAVLYPAPSATGGLADVTYDQNTGVQTVDVSGDFTNAVGGSWSVAGAGATISTSGVVSLPTVTARDNASVVVTYVNSGGVAQSGFSVTVEAPVGVTNVMLLMVAGQSNSRVAGNSSATPPTKYTDGSLGDVYIFVKGSGANTFAEITAGSFVAYDAATNADPDNSGTAWGSEAEFIYQMRQAGDDRPVYIVKESQNGQNLAVQWYPDTSNDNFEHLEAKVVEARTQITDTINDEVVLWNQGEADANDDTMAAAYATNWPYFLSEFRSRISTGYFVAERIRPLGYEGASVTDNSAGFLRAWQVREAVSAGILADGNGYVVDTDFIESNFNSIHPVEPWTEGKGLRCWHAFNGTYNANYGSPYRRSPGPFTVPDLTDVTTGTVILSDAISLTLIERQVYVDLPAGAEFRTLNSLKGDELVLDWTNAGYVDKYQKIQFRVTSSGNASTATNVLIDIQGVTDTWTVTTASGAASYEAETDAFIAQVATNGGGTISGADAAALDAFYVTAKASTWWPKMFRMYASMGDAVASSLDLVGQSVSMVDASADPLNAWTWSSGGVGWQGQTSANGGMDLQVNPSTDLPQDDCAFGLWYNSYASGTQGELNSIPDDHFFMRMTSAGAARVKVAQSSNTTATGVSTAHVGLRVGQREGANSVKIYDYDGTELDSEADASLLTDNTQMVLGNTAGSYSDATIAGFFAADAQLTPAEISAMNTAVETLQAHFSA
jgi:hypothetical protein